MGRDIALFGEWIRAKRTELGWTQKELAIRAGISRTSLSKLENNKVTNFNCFSLFKLAKAFSIEVREMPLDKIS